VKAKLRALVKKDLDELARLGLSPAPIHISNSSDPLQPLETAHKDTLFLLQQLQRHQKTFTTITMLTKNPTLLCSPEYLEVIQSLSTFQVEVTCPFSRDAPRKEMERGAPKIEGRLEAMRTLRENGVTVCLRMDPVFPRNPLPPAFFEKPTLADYDAPETQTEEDIEYLIRFAAEVGCSRVIVSPLKLTIGRFNESTLLSEYRELYKAANRGKLIRKGSAFRMPWALYQYWIEEPTALAHSLGVRLVYCKKNLFTTC
jgi:DNA repair photolyase